jgi:hypothetical protein
VLVRKTQMDLSGYVLETRREDGEVALYRARPQGDSGSVLVQAPVADRLSPASLKRIDHEYALAPEMDPAYGQSQARPEARFSSSRCRP